MGTDYQGTYRIWGPPGTGKTNTLIRQCARILELDSQAKILICSLTKTAAKEIASRNKLLPDFRIGTLHSHAYHLLQGPKITETKLKDWNLAHPQLQLNVKSFDIDDIYAPEHTDRGQGDERYQEMQLFRAKEIPRQAWPSTRTQEFARLWDDYKQQTETLDFTDLIEIAVDEFPDPPYESEILIADEAQDLSKLEMSLLIQWARSAGTLMLAGDSWQTLYEWRGADPTIFTSQEKGRFPEPCFGKDRDKILPKSYRLPPKILKASMTWAKHFSDYRDLGVRARDSKDLGIVTDCSATYNYPAPMIDEILRELRRSTRTIMILTPCSYMLRPTIAALREEGLPFSNPWRTKRGDWNPMQFGRRMSPRLRVLNFLRIDHETFEDQARLWTWSEVHSWAEVLTAKDTFQPGIKTKIKKWGEEIQTAVVRADPAEFLTEEAAAQLVGCVTTKQYLDWYRGRLLAGKTMIMDYPIKVARRWGGEMLVQNERIFIGTIHSFKGAEADICYLVPDLSSPWYRDWATGNSNQKDGVVRLFYVGMTRAKEELRILKAANTSQSVRLML